MCGRASAGEQVGKGGGRRYGGGGRGREEQTCKYSRQKSSTDLKQFVEERRGEAVLIISNNFIILANFGTHNIK